MNIGEQPEDAKTGSAAAQEVLFEHLAAPPVMIVPCFNRPSSANRVRLAPSRPQSTPFVGGGARPAHVPAHGNFGANSNYGDFAAVRRRVEQHISAVDQTAAPDIVVTEIPAVASPAAPPGRRPLPRQAAARFGSPISTSLEKTRGHRWNLPSGSLPSGLASAMSIFTRILFISNPSYFSIISLKA